MKLKVVLEPSDEGGYTSMFLHFLAVSVKEKQ
jgi:hypothetical protein